MRTRRGLDGQVVVISGAARGIGAALAAKVASRGGTPVLIGLEPDVLAEVAGRIGAPWWPVDVTDADGLTEVAKAISARLGRVDAVVANAGAASGGSLLVADPRAYERTIEINLLGSIRTARAFLPALVESGGHFLQIASLAAMVPAPLMGAYCASKSGVEAFAHCLAGEMAAHGVTVGVAYLSWTDTDMVRGAAQMRGVGKAHPLDPAVERIAEGLARRSLHVYGQGFLAVMPLVRGVLPTVMLRLARAEIGRQVGRAEARFSELGTEATGLVGPGGRAAAAGLGAAGLGAAGLGVAPAAGAGLGAAPAAGRS